MKTPRELLLDRHRNSGLALDRLRQTVMRGLREEDDCVPEEQPVANVGFLGMFWQELFVACRRYWMGLGAVWCAIVLFAVAGNDDRTTPGFATVLRSEPIIQAIRDQQQLRDELLGVRFTQQVRIEEPDPVTRPRSEATMAFVTV